MSRRSSPTDKSKPTNKSTEMSTEKSTEKSTKILLKPHIESAPMKSTGWSPKRTSKDDYRIKMNLRLNAEYR
jgi:hypothetical protein